MVEDRPKHLESVRLLAGLGLIFFAAGCTGMRQTQASYEAAFRNGTTAPSYVQLTVIDGRNGVVTPLCTLANFILGAIRIETESRIDFAQAQQTALASQDRRFTFYNPEALANIPLRYTHEELTEARRLIADLSESRLLAEFAGSVKARSLDEILQLPKAETQETRLRKLPNEAVACALIERGYSPYREDRSGRLRVEKKHAAPAP